MNVEIAPSTRTQPAATDADLWLDWVLRVRHGGDPAYAAVLERVINDIRDRLLDHADIRPGDAVADVGCGDGLAGLGALARVPGTTATFVDVSPALVAYAHDRAAERGFASRSRFLTAPAQRLTAIADASLDVVLVRAVLAYIDDKGAAVREFRRILRPGGRISIVDPIFADGAFALVGLAAQRNTDRRDPGSRYAELYHRLRSKHFPDSLDEIRRNSLTNYTERTLLGLLESNGFTNVHLRLHIDTVAAPPIRWETFLATAPRAGVPTVGEILDADFTPAERDEFRQLFRARVETGSVVERNINAYLFAEVPAGR
jgi:ubiquinone/menaquinone biosynthesis C-methylase UbiE